MAISGCGLLLKRDIAEVAAKPGDAELLRRILFEPGAPAAREETAR